MQNKNHKVNISSIYGKSHRKFAISFLNAFILSLHSGFQHNEKPKFEHFIHRRFPNCGFPLYVEIKNDVEEISRTIEVCIKGKIQDDSERVNVNLWRYESIPIQYVKTIEMSGKRFKILSTDHFVPSWLK